MARENDGENKKREAQRCGHRHHEDHVATASHGESFALPPNGLELTGDGGAAAGVPCSDVLGAIDISATPLPDEKSQQKDDYATPQDLPRVHEVRNDYRNRDPRSHQGQSAAAQPLDPLAHTNSPAPNGLRLSGERSGAERVRCSRGFGARLLDELDATSGTIRLGG